MRQCGGCEDRQPISMETPVGDDEDSTWAAASSRDPSIGSPAELAITEELKASKSARSTFKPAAGWRTPPAQTRAGTTHPPECAKLTHED